MLGTFWQYRPPEPDAGSNNLRTGWCCDELSHLWNLSNQSVTRPVLPELFCQNAPLPENRLFCASPEIAFDKKSKKRLFCAKKKALKKSKNCRFTYKGVKKRLFFAGAAPKKVCAIRWSESACLARMRQFWQHCLVLSLCSAATNELTHFIRYIYIYV